MNASEKRVLRDIKEIQEDGTFQRDFGIVILSETLNNVKVEFDGPASTPFETGKFQIELKIGCRYPLKPPEVKFITRVFHPNVAPVRGTVCVDVLKNKWRCVMGISQVILTVIELMREPNSASPLNVTAATFMEESPTLYPRTATMWTHVFANGTKVDEEFNSKLKMLEDMQLGDTQGARLLALTTYKWEVEQAVPNLLAKRYLLQESSDDEFELPDIPM